MLGTVHGNRKHAEARPRAGTCHNRMVLGTSIRDPLLSSSLFGLGSVRFSRII
jgi:hypothetical protein